MVEEKGGVQRQMSQGGDRETERMDDAFGDGHPPIA
jgi:hypothetical protein